MNELVETVESIGATSYPSDTKALNLECFEFLLNQVDLHIDFQLLIVIVTLGLGWSQNMTLNFSSIHIPFSHNAKCNRDLRKKNQVHNRLQYFPNTIISS